MFRKTRDKNSSVGFEALHGWSNNQVTFGVAPFVNLLSNVGSKPVVDKTHFYQ